MLRTVKEAISFPSGLLVGNTVMRFVPSAKPPGEIVNRYFADPVLLGIMPEMVHDGPTISTVIPVCLFGSASTYRTGL